MGKTAGIYVRISQDREGAGLGIERQEKDCRKLAKQLGWAVHAVYPDNDVSAYSGKRRKHYEVLLADIEAGRISGVIAWHPDRLHRSPLELERYIELSEKYSAQTHTVQAGAWDLSTPSGRAVARTLGAWARYESEHKGERIRRARLQQAHAGGWHGGIRPYGFEKDGVTVRSEEAAEIVRITEAIVTGQSLRSLVRDLNERGMPTVTAKGPWTSMALKDIIMRPRNAGLSSYHGEIVGNAVWPALVPVETWRAACAILSDNSRRTNHVGGMVRWLGSGLYVCGVCGQPDLRVGSSTGKRRSYRCRNRALRNDSGHVTREAHALDDFVETLLVGRLSDPRVLNKLREVPENNVDTRSLQVELLALGKRQDKLGEMFAAGQINERAMISGINEAERRSKEIDSQLAAIGERTPLDVFAKAKDGDDIVRIWYGLGGPSGDRSGGLSLGARRAILSRLLTITVNPQSGKPIRQPNGTYLDRDSIGREWKS